MLPGLCQLYNLGYTQNMQRLINRLKQEFHSKPSPGPILNELGEDKLTDLVKRYPDHNSKALWVGAYLADMFITEAIQGDNITQHVPMALDYAKKIIITNHISSDEAEIILEIIATHHGGEQKHLESKLFKNADCFKFLMPRGVFHIFGAMYSRSNEIEPNKKFVEAMQYTMFKVNEKYQLVDLDDTLKREAKELYDHWQYFFAQVGVAKKTPPLYSK